MSITEQKKEKVVLVGYGWAGKSFAKNIDNSKFNFVTVSDKNYFTNTTKLFNLINTDESNSPIELVDENSFVSGKCVKVNEKEKTIELNDGTTINYDKLVLAIGSEANTFGIKGEEYLEKFKTYEDHINLKQKLEGKNNLTIGIIGAGPTGIELAFTLKKNTNHNIIVVEGATILPTMSEYVQKHVMTKMETDKIMFIPKFVQSIEDKGLVVDNKKISVDMAIWTAGIKPNSIIKTLIPTYLDQRGFVNTNKKLKVTDNIYALGDIVKDNGPPTAQNAKQQGKYLAKLFNNGFEGNDYQYKPKGHVISLGDELFYENGFHKIIFPMRTKVIFNYFYELF